MDCKIVNVQCSLGNWQTAQMPLGKSPEKYHTPPGPEIICICKATMNGSMLLTWRSGYRYLNKGECNLNQSKDDSFVERVAKNNS